MRSTQTLAASASNLQHPLHYISEHPNRPKFIKTTPRKLYHTDTLAKLPPCPPQTSLRKHIYTHITHRSINPLKNNTMLGDKPPEIHPSESSLPREDRVHLARLRCGHHPALLGYQKRLDDSLSDVCTGCNTAPHNIKHIMEDCTALNYTRQQHNIHNMRELWESPGRAVAFLRESGLFGQAT